MNIFKKVGLFFLDIIEVALISLAIFVVVYFLLFQPHQVRGNSMLPNFEDKEYLLTDKISYRFNEPQRGEVIIFKAPKNEEYEYIKRVIGIPDDRVMIENGKVFLNGLPLNESYLPQDTFTRAGPAWPEGEEKLVSQGGYFVLGDNRPRSSDSRDWGLVPVKNIIGKAWFRYWPLNSVGSIEKIEY